MLPGELKIGEVEKSKINSDTKIENSTTKVLFDELIEGEIISEGVSSVVQIENFFSQADACMFPNFDLLGEA